jgi:hypothetical protein
MLTFLLSCTCRSTERPASQDIALSITDTTEVCEGVEIEGSFYPGWDFCHQAEPLRAMCGRLPGWSGEGCPSFEVSLEHYLSMAHYAGEVIAVRCAGSPSSYDVLYYAPVSLDINDGDILVFDTSGEMLAFIDLYYGTGLRDNCCEGHVANGWSWGERLDVYCDTHTTLPIGAPDTSDTFDTAQPSLTGGTSLFRHTADTTDTGKR